MMRIPRTPGSNSGSLTNRIYRQLRNGIITGRIPSGTRLVESSLAGEMEVSRTPVREALQNLALEGLLCFIPRAGYMVEDLSRDDIHDLFATRTAIERIAAKWAVERISMEELGRLRENLRKTDKVLRTTSTEEMIHLDTEFHRIIYKATRSKKLYQISQTLSDHTLKFRIGCIHYRDVAQRARTGHFRIYEAMCAKNPRMVDKAILSHLRDVEEDILKYLEIMKQEAFIREDSEL